LSWQSNNPLFVMLRIRDKPELQLFNRIAGGNYIKYGVQEKPYGILLTASIKENDVLALIGSGIQVIFCCPSFPKNTQMGEAGYLEVIA